EGEILHFELRPGAIFGTRRGRGGSGIPPLSTVPLSKLAEAARQRSLLLGRVHRFFQKYDFLVMPVSQVPPFDVEQPYVEEVEGVSMETYIDWMQSCYFVTVTGLPAISVPFGFTGDGLPVGIQIVGRHHDEWGVLQLAYAIEQATGTWQQAPGIATGQDS
ncbi:MAG: amidase family protein, partial [Pirellulaceae bacterium]